MGVRRVVVSNGEDGRSVVQIDGDNPRTADMASLPGMSASFLWATPPLPTVGNGPVADPTPTAAALPARGGAHLMMVTFPPDSSMSRADFDPMAYGAEMMAALPELVMKFEPDNPGMHTTDSIDYDIVFDGEIVLELDDGQTVYLQRGDVVIQHGTRHAWRNRSDRNATMLFVLVGADRS